jgi:hypothetical protein
MGAMAISGYRNDDPRKLREMLGRAASLAQEHAVSSVVVGFAGVEGDLLFPELVDFVESALRVDDAVFRMTRDRAVMVLADVDEARAREIVERILSDFRERFTAAQDPELRLGFYEIPSDTTELTVKQVLPVLFARSAH